MTFSDHPLVPYPIPDRPAIAHFTPDEVELLLTLGLLRGMPPQPNQWQVALAFQATVAEFLLRQSTGTLVRLLDPDGYVWYRDLTLPEEEHLHLLTAEHMHYHLLLDMQETFPEIYEAIQEKAEKRFPHLAPEQGEEDFLSLLMRTLAEAAGQNVQVIHVDGNGVAEVVTPASLGFAPVDQDADYLAAVEQQLQQKDY